LHSGRALVFEVRQSRRTGEHLVRVFYTAQSFDQLRNLTPLTVLSPPETAQLVIPGGSKPGASLDVKFEIFQQLMRNAIGPQYVQNPMLESPPGVLAVCLGSSSTAHGRRIFRKSASRCVSQCRTATATN